MMKLITGDCLDKLREMEDNSVDSVVTDPPYHLQSIVKRFGKPGSAPAKDKDGLFKRQSKGFMGKEWDGGDIAFRTEVWEECLRVLKPGGHLLAFSASRNYHRMAVAIEDAGFEIRDQLMWIYGSGFPKSHNIGKNVDKKLGNEREETDYIAPDGRKRWGGNSFSVGEEPDGRGINKRTKGTGEYEGWGTALKPAHEPIVMARKPLSEKTIVDNVLEWGTGGINIDESRIPFDMNDKNPATNPLYRQQNEYKMPEKGKESKGSVSFTSSNNEIHQEGRFPANVLLSEEAAEDLDQHQDNTSRYFYVAKPSKKEKEFGMTGDDKILNRVNSGGIENDPKWKPVVRKNTHPTVKPIKLMEYLIKMVTPKGGITLDPFMGSGSTGIAALTNGFDFIGIEREQEYMDIARQRITSWTTQVQTKLDL